ncbi:hypothetical protein [Bosea sp. PAMC 26642]|uniref:hypothetical protein n=1 Tax=Bosea sp. (strain PAMC 26642) TaxID=1792307 RepID=UPI00077061A4|nr:hypothetical protein [Bosea sp. PAMC 26642]AMJ60054.1 hypothetical protein AXW83_06860 [Bosea sp. PAMC 26642]
MMRTALACLALMLPLGAAVAQETRDLGLPPQSGSQYPVLPPQSGSQNPVLPPQSGQRYVPGVGGQFSGDDIPGSEQRPGQSPRRSGSGEIGVAGSLAPSTQAFAGEELDRLADIAPALRRCWQPPEIDGPNAGAMATVRFSLRRDGTLFGQPRVTWEATRTEPDLRQRFTDSVVAAVRGCTPMRLSPQLGASIAGRPFTIRFHGRAPSNEKAI